MVVTGGAGPFQFEISAARSRPRELSKAALRGLVGPLRASGRAKVLAKPERLV